MAIIVENGTIVPNANSYNSDAEYVAYAAARGITIGADVAAREIELIRATDYVDNELTRMQSKTSATQSLRYPQIGSDANGVLVGKNTIPNELKRAQLEAAISVFKGVFDVVATPSNIKSESLVTGFKTEYFEDSIIEPKSDNSDTYLDMLSPTAGGSSFSVVNA